LLPSYTFTATAAAARYLGAEAVFVDIAEDSYNVDTRALERTVEQLAGNKSEHSLKPRAIIAVHIGGLPCGMAEINRIAAKYKLAVVEDAAHAFPARTTDGQWAGCCGDIGVFSFYATKTITTGEGGMVVTKHKELADRISVMRSHGIDRSVWNRYTDTKASWYYEVAEPGFKYNLPDLLAAVGRVQLGRAMELLSMRQKIAERYDKAFAARKELIISQPGGARHLYQVRLQDAEKRDGFIEALRKKNIGTSVHFIPLHIMPYYRSRYNLTPEDFPNSYRRFKETVSLPVWPGMTDQQTDLVIETVIETLDKKE
jgi:dTDP-4-amino-4,6-dideoxygalactose transaminase